MEEEFRQLTQERDQLSEALEEANQKITALESIQEQTGPIRLSVENRVISLDAIVANARLEIVKLLREKQIELEVINPEATAMIKTDPGLVHSVVYNLLVNAIKASTRAAEVQLHQKLSFETGMLVIQVTDFGKGLTAKEQTALFSSNPPEMPGIGSLESIREAVRAIRVLNGKIWLRSKPDSFTTFRVQLPVRIID
jgi:signal transduction histidine kinase